MRKKYSLNINYQTNTFSYVLICNVQFIAHKPSWYLKAPLVINSYFSQNLKFKKLLIHSRSKLLKIFDRRLI